MPIDRGPCRIALWRWTYTRRVFKLGLNDRFLGYLIGILCQKARSAPSLNSIYENIMAKVTVIGGSGFVGTNFCTRLLEIGVDFEILDIRESRKFPEHYRFADVRDVRSLEEAISGDIILNLAAVHRDDVKDRQEYWDTNVTGAQNIVRSATSKKIQKIIFTSTVAVYGFAEAGTDETGEINPFNDYGVTKHEAEKIFMDWASLPDNSLHIVRPTVIFGEGNRGNVFNLLNQIASGKFVMVGSGQNKKSMAYIGNIVSFLEACLTANEKVGIYNYVDTPDLTMNELVSLVRSKVGKNGKIGFRLPVPIALLIGRAADLASILSKRNLPISAIRVKKFVSTTEFQTAKGEMGGFRQKFSLEDGLTRTIESEFLNPDPNREIFYTE